MAKRRRLNPANTTFFEAVDPPSSVPRAPIAEVAHQTASVAAVEEMARSLQEAREGGRMVIEVPLAAVHLDYLVRDRIAVDAEEMKTLEASIAARGQQTPIEIVKISPGHYGLISGWRRIKALSSLYERTGEARYSKVLGLVRRPAERADAYLAMVEENEIRVGLSYVERAGIVDKSVAQGVFPNDRVALQSLFASASRAKRSKIGAFLPVVRAIGDVLPFPQALGERLGLQLSRAFEQNVELVSEIRTAIQAEVIESPDDQIRCFERILQRTLKTDDTEKSARAVIPKDLTPKRPETRKNDACSPAGGMQSPYKVVEGISLVQDAPSRLTLEGSGIDDAFRAKLVSWLRNE